MNGQSILNGYGFGLKTEYYDASSMALSSYGLTPSFNQNVSIQNPSTWHHLRYTYFSSSFSLNQTEILNDFINSDFSLGDLFFIVPIKGKYSFGLGVSPYTDQYYLLEGEDATDFVAYGDTLTKVHYFESFGGISALNIAGSMNIFDQLDIGLEANFLYGSTRQQTINSLNSLNYYSQQRYLYAGILGNIYLSSNILNNWNIPLMVYASLGFTIEPVSTEAYYFKPFEDTNDSGAQDSFDFPSSNNAVDPDVINIENILEPFEYQFGLNYNWSKNTCLIGEYSVWKDNSDLGAEYSRLAGQIKSRNHFNFGIARYSLARPDNLFDRMSFRLSSYITDIDLTNNDKNIKEYGVSTGLSYNFGITKNQIDFAYSYGKRQNLVAIGDEIIQKFSIGITVGDIWFVKRRSR